MDLDTQLYLPILQKNLLLLRK